MAQQADELTKSNDPKVRYVVSKFTESRDYYKDLRGKFSDWDDMFFSLPDRKRYDWMSNLFIPLTHKAVMTLLSRVMNNCFAVDPNFDVVPSNLKLSNLIRSQFHRGDYYTSLYLFCLQMLIRGTSIGKVSWRKQTKTRFTLEKVTENILKQITNILGLTEEVKVGEKLKGYKKSKPKDVIRYDGPIFETIDLFDFFPEPTAIDLNSGAKIMRSIKTKDEVINNPNYKNKDQVLASEFPEDTDFPHSRLEDIGLIAPSYLPNEELKGKGKEKSEWVEILECETKWYNEETDKMENWLIVVANRDVIVRDEESPYWNLNTMYVRGNWLPILGEFYGVGIPELGECIQEEYNDKRNQRIDNINQVLQPIFMYEEGSIDPKILAVFERKPGGKLRLRAGGILGTKWDECPDVTVNAMLECQKLENDFEEVTGAVKAIQPASTPGADIHRTSSGLMLLQSMANEKIKLNLSLFEKMVLEPIFDKYFELNLQFLNPGYKILDPEGKMQVYQPDDIVGDFEFKAKGSRYALDQQIKLMNISRTIEALGSSGIPPGELHIRFWMRLYDALGFEDKEEVEKILREEIRKFNQMQAQLQMAKAQGKGGSPNIIQQLSGQGMGADAMRSGAGQNIPGGDYGV